MLPKSFLFISLLLGIQIHITEPTGLVYYPPYTDPMSHGDPCLQYDEWNLEEGFFVPPKLDQSSSCKGSISGIPFIAPKGVRTNYAEVSEDFFIDLSDSTINSNSYSIVFTCKDGNGRVKSGIYSWFYTYRVSGVIKSFSYQGTMSWDNMGRMVFQPTETVQAQISCRHYDSSTGYHSAVRKWRLIFGKKTMPNPPTSTAQIYTCRENATLRSVVEQTVIVPSNQFQFSAFCPVVSCVRIPGTAFQTVAYYPQQPACKASASDPASYSICSVNPLKETEIKYRCSSLGSPQGQVALKIQSGARFSNEHDFKLHFIKEDDRNLSLFCSVEPSLSLGIVPKWEFLSATIAGASYGPLPPPFQQIDNVGTGKHQLLLQDVQPEHAGSYRCTIAQSSRNMIRDEIPIYGYHFVKVYSKPQCNVYAGELTKPLNIIDGLVHVSMWNKANSHITIACSHTIVETCPGRSDVCAPVAVLRKDGNVCSMSNMTRNVCDGAQRIQTSSASAGVLRMDIMLDAKAGADEQSVGGFYTVRLYYPAPVSLHFDVPFEINANFLTTTTTTTTETSPTTTEPEPEPDGGLNVRGCLFLIVFNQLFLLNWKA